MSVTIIDCIQSCTGIASEWTWFLIFHLCQFKRMLRKKTVGLISIQFTEVDQLHILYASTKIYANWMSASSWLLCLKTAITFTCIDKPKRHRWFIVLFRLIWESEPNTGWLIQVSHVWLLSKIKSMIIHYNFRHTYSRLLSEKIVTESIMPNVSRHTAEWCFIYTTVCNI